jgi:hypothetical protein
MRKLAILLSLVLAASFAGAQDARPDPTAAKAAPAAGRTHEIEAEVVAFDAGTQTLTIKGTPDNKTVPVDAAAIPQVRDLKPGQKVTLVCRDNEAGEHQAVSAVKPAKGPAKMEDRK